MKAEEGVRGVAEEKSPEEKSPGTARAITHSERFREAMTQTRTRTDLTAKGLAAVGTAAITALGYAKLADVFPFGGPTWALLCLLAGMIGMVLAVVLLVRRFFGASQVIITSPDLWDTANVNDLNYVEREQLGNAYEDSAKANGFESLLDLDKTARKFEGEALTLKENDKAKAKPLERQAERLLAEVQAAQDRGAAFIVRRRSTYALFGWPSLLFLALFAIGWYGTALGADALEGARKGDVDVAVACAEARAKEDIAEDELPDICGEKEGDGEGEGEQQAIGGPGKIKRRAIGALIAAHSQCRKAAKEVDRSTRVCRSLNRSLRFLRAPGFQPLH